MLAVIPSAALTVVVLVISWVTVVSGALNGGATGPSLIVSAVALSALTLGVALLVARRAALLVGRRPVRVPVRRDAAARPLPRAVDPDRPSHSRPRAPGCGQA